MTVHFQRLLCVLLLSGPQFAFVFGLPILGLKMRGGSEAPEPQSFVTECSTVATSANADGGIWTLPIAN